MSQEVRLTLFGINVQPWKNDSRDTVTVLPWDPTATKSPAELTRVGWHGGPKEIRGFGWVIEDRDGMWVDAVKTRKFRGKLRVASVCRTWLISKSLLEV